MFRDLGSLQEGLKALAGTGKGHGPETRSKVAFVYTGQASQWVGMGKALYENEPVVRAVLDCCDDVLRGARGASLLDVMFGRSGSDQELDDPAWKQPAIYALECALTALWSSAGIRPDVVTGHSLGEIAAAQAAGVFGLEDGLRFAATRGELVAALQEEGAMGAVFAPESRVAEVVDNHNAASGGASLSIAADNGAHQAISGLKTDVEAVLKHFEVEGVRVARLRTSPAYHSALVEPVLEDLEASCAGMPLTPPAIPLVSSMTGRLVEPGRTLDGAYWRQQMRDPVAFRSAVATLAGLGVDTLVEIGPHAVLGPMATLAWPASVPGAENWSSPPWCWRACCAPRPEFHRRMQTRHSLWPSREPTRQGSRYPLRGYSRERRGVGYHYPAIPSSVNATGSSRQSGGERVPITCCSATVTNPPAVRSPSILKYSPPIQNGWATTVCITNSWCRARCLDQWQQRYPPARGPDYQSWKTCNCTTR